MGNINTTVTGIIPAATSEKRVYTVNEIQDILGIGRTTAYALVKRNVFHSIRVGQKILISRKSFEEWLNHS